MKTKYKKWQHVMFVRNGKTMIGKLFCESLGGRAWLVVVGSDVVEVLTDNFLTPGSFKMR